LTRIALHVRVAVHLPHRIWQSGPRRSRRAFLLIAVYVDRRSALEMPWPVAGSYRSSHSRLPSRRAAACGLSARPVV